MTAGIPRRGPTRVVRRHGLAVVDAFVAKQAAERGQAVGAGNQTAPEVVADLVAEMADDRAERLAQLHSDSVSVTILDLGEIQRHDTVQMAGHPPLARDVHEIEHEPIGCRHRTHLERKCERVQLVDEPPLRRFGPHPRLDCVGPFTVGTTSGQPAGTTPHGVGTRRQHPVATPRRVHATPPQSVVTDDLVRRLIIRWQQHPDRSILADISERYTTCPALLRRKRHPLSAPVAVEDLHLSGPSPWGSRSSRSPIA